VKGKDRGVTIFEPLGLEEKLSPELLERARLFKEFLFLYRSQDWDEGEETLRNLLRNEPGCFLYELYLERIEHFRKNPPGQDWDGIFTFETK
jgi:adenylate cyclase